jgi:hypothetical protein
MGLYRIGLSFFAYLRAASDGLLPICTACICQTQRSLLPFQTCLMLRCYAQQYKHQTCYLVSVYEHSQYKYSRRYLNARPRCSIALLTTAISSEPETTAGASKALARITRQPALAPSPQPRPALRARALPSGPVAQRGPFWMPIDTYAHQAKVRPRCRRRVSSIAQFHAPMVGDTPVGN